MAIQPLTGRSPTSANNASTMGNSDQDPPSEPSGATPYAELVALNGEPRSALVDQADRLATLEATMWP